MRNLSDSLEIAKRIDQYPDGVVPVYGNEYITIWQDSNEVKIPISAIGTGSGGGTAINSYRHIQSVSSSIWNITHNLAKYPSVVTITSGEEKEQVFGNVFYVDFNHVRVEFNGNMTGEAYLV